MVERLSIVGTFPPGGVPLLSARRQHKTAETAIGPRAHRVAIKRPSCVDDLTLIDNRRRTVGLDDCLIVFGWLKVVKVVEETKQALKFIKFY